MWICGIDEVGRGALAGPLCVAAFCCQSLPTFYTNDSKKLTPYKRLIIFRQIINFIKSNQNNSFTIITFIDNYTIDKINILQANLLGFELIINKIHQKLNCKPHVIYIDGNTKPNLKDFNIITQVKADSNIKVVQIASIIAKVTRDKLMEKLHNSYPQYNFINNKGYYDVYHERALKQYGPSPIHRRTFIRKIIQLSLF